MSKYTNVILFVSGLEDVQDRIKEVNQFKHNNKEISLFDLNEKHHPDIFPRFTFSGCYNYFDTEEFLTHIKDNVQWQYPEYVQLFVKEEGFLNCSVYINACDVLLYSAIKD